MFREIPLVPGTPNNFSGVQVLLVDKAGAPFGQTRVQLRKHELPPSERQKLVQIMSEHGAAAAHYVDRGKVIKITSV